MKLRLVLTYDPARDAEMYWIEKQDFLGIWQYVACSSDHDEAYRKWDRAKTFGVKEKKTVIEEYTR